MIIGNWTLSRTIQGVIGLVILNRPCSTLGQFRNYSPDYSLNFTPLGSITITNYWRYPIIFVIFLQTFVTCCATSLHSFPLFLGERGPWVTCQKTFVKEMSYKNDCHVLTQYQRAHKCDIADNNKNVFIPNMRAHVITI